MKSTQLSAFLGVGAVGLGSLGLLGLLGVPVARANLPAPTPDDGKAEVRVLLTAREAAFNRPSTAVANQWDEIRAAEAFRWRKQLPGGGHQTEILISGHDTTAPWVNLGPTDVVTQYNGGSYEKFDSGRPVAVVADPSNPEIVYNATADGGVWKTHNFLSGYPSPSWQPLTDGLPNLSIGAFAIDPTHPSTLYLVTGDAFDSRTGVSVYKSKDGGGTWGAPIPLAAPYPGLTTPFRPLSARDAKVDPTNAANVLVSTEAGLFRSTDGGVTFSWVDLPNGGVALAEATWSITYVGGTSWLVSGVTACQALPPVGGKFARQSYPPTAGFAQDPSMGCTLGNQGDLWRSADGGATWQSLLFPKTGPSPLPPAPTGDAAVRITLAAGKTTDPAHTTVYAYVGNYESSQTITHNTLGFWRSRDGGATWVDATGTLANPTVTDKSCADMDLGHNQTYYNQALAVDPMNDDNVFAGGNLCSIRTLSGTSDSPTWENVSYWLTIYASALVSSGKLSYAHADWHGASVVTVAGKPLLLGANDGGVYSSRNLFDPGSSPSDVLWNGNNRGLVTHLAYGVGSGDPATGNGYLAIMGLQDNGTWVRPTAETSTGYLELFPTTFQGISGGDGIGSAVSTGTQADLWYASVEFAYSFCDNNHQDCTQGSSYVRATPPIPMGDPDSAPFLVYYAHVPTDATGLTTLTHTSNRVFRSEITPAPGPSMGPPVIDATAFAWVAASPDFTTIDPSITVRTPAAARFIPNLTGAVFNRGNDGAPVVAVNSSGGADAASWTVSAPLPLKNGVRLTSVASLDFPNAVTAGKAPGDELIVASDNVHVSDGSLVPNSMGRIWKTSDRGQTWTSISGEAGPSPLPNLPVFVVKFDPADATSQTLYAGTLIGVYVTTDGGATWARFGSGLPFVQVTDLYLARNGEFLRISTYGRGLWEVYPSELAPHGVNGNGDYDMNQQIDWIDVAAAASRLGTTPGTATLPRYNSLCDVTSPPITPMGPAPTGAIDELDLSAILSTFAGQP